mmetsp:Transcript_26132/g.67371  ORF Transcript_26132/g.67371 Transcript_26132/m.67371 type:complete len:531 (+) Transcript_26132:318-1910(+)
MEIGTHGTQGIPLRPNTLPRQHLHLDTSAIVAVQCRPCPARVVHNNCLFCPGDMVPPCPAVRAASLASGMLLARVCGDCPPVFTERSSTVYSFFTSPPNEFGRRNGRAWGFRTTTLKSAYPDATEWRRNGVVPDPFAGSASIDTNDINTAGFLKILLARQRRWSTRAACSRLALTSGSAKSAKAESANCSTCSSLVTMRFTLRNKPGVSSPLATARIPTRLLPPPGVGDPWELPVAGEFWGDAPSRLVPERLGGARPERGVGAPPLGARLLRGVSPRLKPVCRGGGRLRGVADTFLCIAKVGIRVNPCCGPGWFVGLRTSRRGLRILRGDSSLFSSLSSKGGNAPPPEPADCGVDPAGDGSTGVPAPAPPAGWSHPIAGNMGASRSSGTANPKDACCFRASLRFRSGAFRRNCAGLASMTGSESSCTMSTVLGSTTTTVSGFCTFGCSSVTDKDPSTRMICRILRPLWMISKVLRTAVLVPANPRSTRSCARRATALTVSESATFVSGAKLSRSKSSKPRDAVPEASKYI